MKKQYSYNVAGIVLDSREAAREVQRSIRRAYDASNEAHVETPRIIQQIVVERVVR